MPIKPETWGAGVEDNKQPALTLLRLTKKAFMDYEILHSAVKIENSGLFTIVHHLPRLEELFRVLTSISFYRFCFNASGGISFGIGGKVL